AAPTGIGGRSLDGAGPAGRVVRAVGRQCRGVGCGVVVDEGAGAEGAAGRAVGGGVGGLDLDGVGVAVGELRAHAGGGVAPVGVCGAGRGAPGGDGDPVGAAGGGEVGGVPAFAG